jgi:serine protease Do
MMRLSAAAVFTLVAFAQILRAEISPDARKKLYDRVTPSLVVVQYVWENEMGRTEISGAGVIVGEDGLVMTSLGLVYPSIPDEQLKEFKIIVPKHDADNEELPAVFLGRDERSSLAFVKTKEKQKWTPLKFEDEKISVGEPVLSVGVLPKGAGYNTYLSQATIAAPLRGEVHAYLVMGGGLTVVGSPVFNADGKAIGFVNQQQSQRPFLNYPDPNNELGTASSPPIIFVPTSDFAISLADPPTEPGSLKLPWMGVSPTDMTGLNKDVAEAMGLKNQPAIEVGGVIPDSPAQKAGLKANDIIVKLNGQALERGDQPEELPMILSRAVRRMKIGQDVKLSVLSGKGQPLREVTIKLEERPKTPNLAKRFYADDLGFTVREAVFVDTYSRKLPRDAKGVVVAFVKKQSSAATAKLRNEDMITEMNGKAVENVDEFKSDYEKLRKDKPREAVVMVVLREAGTETIRIEPPQ